MALKLLLQHERELKPKSSATLATISCIPKNPSDSLSSWSLMNGYSAQRKPLNDLPEQTPLLKPFASVYCDEEDSNLQEEISNEHNYWMQELERRRAGVKRSRRRTCTTTSERATTSPFKVGLVMCSVPLVLVLGFIFFVVLFGDGPDMPSNVKSIVNNVLGFGSGERDAYSIAARHDVTGGKKDKIATAFVFPFEKKSQLEKESPVLKLSLSTGQTKLRGSQTENAGE
ncbi:unnamed protein product [Peronospora belbahrii]|uniref:Uncharacterized protein n=1 Tax=Peronospora belbahrii TaxID=622444 RepID=A0AAU9LHD8_9STRA|nr:unnamed protein product [Peronospora belbahrii]CAH0514268.1 unnamed protein product [Peronospora belbahrii]